MGKTTYSRNPTSAKGIHNLIQSPDPQQKISEYITKIHTKQQRLLRVCLLPMPKNT